MNVVYMGAKWIKSALMLACVAGLLSGCGDSTQKAKITEDPPTDEPKVLPDTLKVSDQKKTYVITGIGLSGTNKVAIINNQVIQPGMEIDDGVRLQDVHSTYAVIVVGQTKHLLRPGDIQRELDQQKP